MTTIDRAAIRLINGNIKSLPRPYRHPDILLSINFEDAVGKVEGFLTDAGEFVNRKEAYKIAKAAGQILPQEDYEGRPNELYTEDMW